MIKKNFVAVLTLGCVLAGSTCFAHSMESERDNIETFKAKIEAQKARCGSHVAFEYFSDEDYANGNVPSDISDIVIEPDDGCGSSD